MYCHQVKRLWASFSWGAVWEGAWRRELEVEGQEAFSQSIPIEKTEAGYSDKGTT